MLILYILYAFVLSCYLSLNFFFQLDMNLTTVTYYMK